MKLSAVHDGGAASDSLVTEKRTRAEERKERRRKRESARLCAPPISGFSDSPGVFANFTRPFTPLSFSLSLAPIVAERAANEQPGNLANDVLKIPDNVFSLLYGPLVLANFLNDKFRA